jgi:hypothetical protein
MSQSKNLAGMSGRKKRETRASSKRRSRTYEELSQDVEGEEGNVCNTARKAGI